MPYLRGAARFLACVDLSLDYSVSYDLDRQREERRAAIQICELELTQG